MRNPETPRECENWKTTSWLFLYGPNEWRPTVSAYYILPFPFRNEMPLQSIGGRGRLALFARGMQGSRRAGRRPTTSPDGPGAFLHSKRYANTKAAALRRAALDKLANPPGAPGPSSPFSGPCLSEQITPALLPGASGDIRGAIGGRFRGRGRVPRVRGRRRRRGPARNRGWA